MISRETIATRAELMAVKRRILIAEKAHRLLKLKRDVLVLELSKMAKTAKPVQEKLEEDHRAARKTMSIAQMMEGSIGVSIVSISIEESPELVAGTRNVMGMRLPVFNPHGIKKDLSERGYGLIGTSSVIDETAETFEELTDQIVRYAEQVAAIRMLTREIMKLNRQVNALDIKVIPNLVELRDTIQRQQDELEREGITRIFWVKKKKGTYR